MNIINRNTFFRSIGINFGNGYWKIRFKIPFETQETIGFDLEHFAQKHKENQTRQAVEKTRTVIHHDVESASNEEDNNSQGNRNIDIQHARFDAFVSRNIVTAGRIQKGRQGQGEYQPTEKWSVIIQPIFLDFKIFGKRKQHDIAKTKESQAQFIG